jgi:hypothetical protein
MFDVNTDHALARARRMIRSPRRSAAIRVTREDLSGWTDGGARTG